MEKVKERINKYDNLRGLAIFLVVFGHLNYSKVLGPFNPLLFMIDLPVLFFVAGYFSKIDIDQPAKSFKRLMVPYFLFCMLIELFRWAYTGKLAWDMIFLQASMGMWFLVALFIMKMILPIMDRLKYPIITTMLFALLFGLYDIHPNILGLSRTFAYLPIFLLGFYFNTYRENFSIQHPKLFGFCDRNFKLLMVILIIITGICLFKISGKFFVFKRPYVGRLEFEAIKRLIIIALDMCWVVALNRIMTNRNCFLTKIGKNSMAVYLLHIFVYYFFKPLWPSLVTGSVMAAILSLAITAVTVYVFSRDVVTKYLNKFTDGVYDLLTKPAG